MASSQMYAPGSDSEPFLYETLQEVLADDTSTDIDHASATRRSRSRCHAVTMVSVLGAGCLLACITMLHLGAFSSRTVDPIVYSSIPKAGSHKVVNQLTGKCLNWETVVVTLKDCDATNPKEMWTYQDGHLRTSDSTCLDMGGKQVHVWKCDLTHRDAIGHHQHWKFDDETSQFQHVAPDSQCLASSVDSTGISLEACNVESDDQRWNVHVHTLVPKSSTTEDSSKQPAEREVAAASKAPELQAANGSGGAPSRIIAGILMGCISCLALTLCAYLIWKKKHTETRMVKVEEEERDLEEAKQADKVGLAEQLEQQPQELEQPEEEAPMKDGEEQGNQGGSGSPFEEAAAQGEAEPADMLPPQEMAGANADEAAPAAAMAAAEGSEAVAEAEAPAASEEPIIEAVPAAEEPVPGEPATEVAPPAEEVAPPVEEVVQAAEEVPATEVQPPTAEETPLQEQPLQEEPQELAAPQEADQAAPQEADAAPQEADQAAPQEADQAAPQEADQLAPVPKKKGKGCVVS